MSPVGLSPDELKSKAIRNDLSKIGHIPLSHALFDSWNPILLARQKVAPEELDGYRGWLKGKGGYFDEPFISSARQLQEMIVDISKKGRVVERDDTTGV